MTATLAAPEPGRDPACNCGGACRTAGGSNCGSSCRCRSFGADEAGRAKSVQANGSAAQDLPTRGASGDRSRPYPKRLRDARIALRTAQMPKSCRATYLKATRGKASPRVAIKAFCLECTGWSRPDVQHCTATACPLWMYRPWKAPKEERPAVAATGRECQNPDASKHGGNDDDQS